LLDHLLHFDTDDALVLLQIHFMLYYVRSSLTCWLSGWWQVKRIWRVLAYLLRMLRIRLICA